MRPRPAALPLVLLRGAAAPAMDCAQQSEAGFVRACLAEGSGPSACRCQGEAIRARLGFAGFLEHAGLGPAAFCDRPLFAPDAAEAARLCVAADWVEPAPARQTRWAATR